jgi:amidophosphoribosyltransferase
MADTVTVMEKIGHFLDAEVAEEYIKCKEKGIEKKYASDYIAENLNLERILKRASRNWDGGYAMAGLLGHGDAFVLRDPNGIRPAFYYHDDEIVVVASERPVIQTVFNVPLEKVKEIDPGHALIVKKNNNVSITEINKPQEKLSCSFERIYFSRGSDASIYQERKKLGKLVLPAVLKSIDNDLKNTVFSYIPNTAETSYYGMIDAANDFLNHQKNQYILNNRKTLTQEKLQEILSEKIRNEKIAIKDAKLRTFITEDSSRDDLVAHVYDVTYGVVQTTDNLVVIDDSIVRGTTLKNSILKILDRLKPKKIVIVSSAPQIRFPDCYGIDMARLDTLVAFNATLALHQEHGNEALITEIYEKCKLQQENSPNFVKEFYKAFSDEQVTRKISEILKPDNINADVEIIFQSVENLHIACPDHLGDWYFTGNYPTAGGNRVANQAFINFYEGNEKRAY